MLKSHLDRIGRASRTSWANSRARQGRENASVRADASGLPSDAEGGDGGGEVVLVDVGVVVAAEQGEVDQGGGSAVYPVFDVVGVGPIGVGVRSRGRCSPCPGPIRRPGGLG